MKAPVKRDRSIPGAVALIVAIVTLALTGGLASQAVAQSRGNSVLPFGPGNPLADLQRQINELRAMVSGPGEYQTVVNCNAGEKVQDALDRAPKGATRVIVTIDGVCNENVSIDRDDVWLQGASQQSGLQASGEFVLLLTGAMRVEINNLTITGTGDNQGLGARNGSSFRSNYLVVKNTGQNAINVSRNSVGFFQHLSLQGGSNNGAWVFRGGEITVQGGEIRDYTGYGVLSDGGNVALNDVSVQRNGTGAMAQNGGKLWLLGATTVESSIGFGVSIVNGSSADISGPEVKISSSGNSALNVDSGSALWLRNGARVTNNPNVTGITVGNGSALTISNHAVVEGSTFGIDVHGGSSALITDGSEIRDNDVNGIGIQDTSMVSFNSGGGIPRISGNGSNGIFCSGSPAVAQFSGVIGVDVAIVGNGNATNCPGH